MYKIKDKLLEIEKKLRDNPKGFDLDDSYMCIVCGKTISEGTGWYDKFGPKCLLCQKAVDDNTIPPEVCIKRDSWLAMWELNLLGLHPRVIRMKMRKKKLKPRVIKDETGDVYFYIFIKKENPVLTR